MRDRDPNKVPNFAPGPGAGAGMTALKRKKNHGTANTKTKSQIEIIARVTRFARHHAGRWLCTVRDAGI